MPPIKHDRREQIRIMRSRGMSFEAIARSLHPPVSRVAVYLMAKRMGLPGNVKQGLDTGNSNANVETPSAPPSA